MRNYLTYPTKKMFISQSYTGTYSHSKNYQGTPKDYPIDESCGSTAKDWFYCPCDEVIVKRIYGVGAKGTNTIWLQSTSPVILANGKESFVTIMVTHPEDDTLKSIKTNDKFKRGQKLFVEGADGNATGNHFHISVSASKYVSGGWEQNSKGGWVIKGNPIKPEEAFYIDDNFTTIMKSNGLKFKTLPKQVGTPVTRDTTKQQIEVIVDELRARKTPNGEILGFINKGIYNVLDTKADKDYTWYMVEENVWIASKEGEWTKIYEIEVINKIEEEKTSDYEDLKTENNPLLHLIDLIIRLIKRIFKK